MIDLYSSAVLAVSVSFQHPSRRSVARVMRQCVRRHRKLPSETIVDRGSDFKSVFFASFLAHYGITNSLRPSSHSRYGGEVEGLFGEFKKQWLCQREGNISDYKEARSVDGKLAPKKKAILRPEDFCRELLTFCDWRENKCRGSSAQSAAVKLEESQRAFPFMGKKVEYDKDFLIVSSVEDKRYSIDFQRGLLIKGMWYFSPAIATLKGKKKSLDVRLDPENPHVVYSEINGCWVPCYSSEINSFSSKDYVAQLVEGMVKHEAAGLRRKVAENDDLELSRIINEMDKCAESSRALPIAEFEITEEVEDETSLFACLEGADVRPVEIMGWGM